MPRHILKNKWFFILTHIVIMGISVPLVKSQIGSPLLTFSHYAQLSAPEGQAALSEPGPEPALLKEQSLIDRHAIAAIVRGDARILRKESPQWKIMTGGEIIEEGDQIRTGKDSYVAVYYDKFYLNMTQIRENSLAEFRSIEPTQIYISRGEVYNSLDGLPEGSSYHVITPTSVGGVRGTRFIRSYDPSNGHDRTIVSKGRVDVILTAAEAGEIKGIKTVQIPEKHSLDFYAHEITGGAFDSIRIEKISPGMEKKLRDIHTQNRGNLLLYAGSPQKIREAERDWHALKTKTDSMKTFRSVFRQNTQGQQSALLYSLTKQREEHRGIAAESRAESGHALAPDKAKKILPPGGAPGSNGAEEEWLVSVNVCENHSGFC